MYAAGVFCSFDQEVNTSEYELFTDVFKVPREGYPFEEFVKMVSESADLIDQFFEVVVPQVQSHKSDLLAICMCYLSCNINITNLEKEYIAKLM